MDTPENLNDIKKERFYRAEEIAPILRINAHTVRRYCVDKVFPNATKIGKGWLIPGADITALFDYVELPTK